jgi:hypothetical protein
MSLVRCYRLSLSITFAAMTFAGLNAAYAGGGSAGGGGVVFACADHVYLADTYSAIRAVGPFLEVDGPKIEARLPLAITKLYPNATFQNPTGHGANVDLKTALDAIEKKLVFTPSHGPIPLLGDDHIPASAVPNGCVKMQVARQDIATGVVLVDESLRARMSSLEIKLLNLHEALIHLRNQPGVDTTSIRATIEDFVTRELVHLSGQMYGSDCLLKVDANNFEMPYDLNKISSNEYSLHVNSLGLDARVIVNGNQASFTIETPSQQVRSQAPLKQIKWTETLNVNIAASSILKDKDPKTGSSRTSYIFCQFGLGDDTDRKEKDYEATLDRLGPAAEWSDALAPSLGSLSIGTRIELKSDINIGQGLAVIESLGAVPVGTYGKAQIPAGLTFPERLAWTQFDGFTTQRDGFKPTDEQIMKFVYPKGLVFVVVETPAIKLLFSPYVGQSNGYSIHLKSTNPAYPDAEFQALGRRNGLADIKTSQWIDMLKPYFKITN